MSVVMLQMVKISVMFLCMVSSAYGFATAHYCWDKKKNRIAIIHMVGGVLCLIGAVVLVWSM